MTTRCALYTIALKIFVIPEYAHDYFAEILIGFCSDRSYEWTQNLKSVALPIPEIIGGIQKNWAVRWMAFGLQRVKLVG